MPRLNKSLRFSLRNGQIWVEEHLTGQWEGWILATRIVADDRKLPVIVECRIFRAEGDVPRGGLPWSLTRRAVTLSKHARYASDQVAGAFHLRGTMTDPITKTLLDRLKAHGFVVDPPEALRRPEKSTSGKGRPVIWTDADYARVALLYDAAIGAQQSPQRAIAAATGEPVTVA